MVDKTDEILNDQASNADNKDQLDLQASTNTNVVTVKLEDELKQSFIDYAMSVIVDRALPDVRDGLKPVHRRVLYDMYDLKIWHNGQTKKSARVVGDVIGRFHPHGDAAVYETIVRMAQWFSMRSPLIFGQGNFGNIDGDGAAAMRYTEVRMTKIAEMMLQDIDKETVNTYPNYDGNEQIPEVLPTRFPNLLVNGSSGIAVGMATNIPPHNLAEVINGTIAMLDNPSITLEQMMTYIQGPDFPTGGYIVGKAGIKEAYATGRGRCVMRARTHSETDKSGRKTIYVDEIPYQVNKSAIVKQIAELVRDKKIDGIAEVNDLSDKDNQVRIAIDLKRDACEESVLNNLYEKTAMQTTFGINVVALVNNSPKQLPLLEILKEFLDFRREIVTRRTVYLLRQDRRKAFIDEGLIVAKNNISKIIEIITNSKNAEDARNALMEQAWDANLIATLIQKDEDGNNICLPQGIEARAGLHGDKYYLAQEQAKAILSLQLQRLTHLATEEIQADYKNLIENIKGYLRILNDTKVMNEVIKNELIEVRDQYSDKRRTDFIADMGKLSKGDFIAKQDVVITLSQDGYIKYQDIASYDSQRRGGKGRLAAKLKDEDFITRVAIANTHDNILCFTSMGRCFVSLVYELPNSDNKTWRGKPIQNLFNIEEGEFITAILPISEINEDCYVMMATAKGFVKKTPLSSFKSFIGRSNANAIKAIKLAQDDILMGVELTSGDDDVVLIGSHGKAIRFCEYFTKKEASDANLDDVEEDNTEELETELEVEAQDNNESDDSSENVVDRHKGSGLRPSGRTSGGVRGIRLPEGAKLVCLITLSADVVDNADLLIACANGYGKRMPVSSIPFRNRGGLGNIVMRNIERNGEIIGAGLVDDDSEYMLITNQGQLIRSPLDEIRQMGKYASGVILMRVSENEQVIAMQTLSKDVVASAKAQSEARLHDKLEMQQALGQTEN